MLQPGLRMAEIEQKLKKFFADYEARTNRALVDPPEVDVEATAGAFADCFVEANPNGVTCGTNGDQLREVIPKGFDFYRSIGTQSMKIAALAVTPLDELHAMVKVHWDATYRKKDGSGEAIDFDVIYFVQDRGEGPKIFAYITGDEQEAYREKGLIPAG